MDGLPSVYRRAAVPLFLLTAAAVDPLLAAPVPLSLAAPAVWFQAAQTQADLSGRVTDQSTNLPLSGAQVTVLDTELGAITGPDGTFRIAGVPAGAQRVRVSMVGYAAQEFPLQITAGQPATLEAQLSSQAIQLEGVVAVGYGTRSTRELPSSVVQVDEERLQGVTTENVAALVQGKVPGVVVTSGNGTPGAAPEVRIRGTGSISANASPLYVVDGVIADASIAQFISPNDIAAVTILKDAAATSLYGSRAANGVIVITTKGGQAGDTRVQVSSTVGYSDAVDGHFDVMNSRELYELYQAMGRTDISDDLLQRDTDWRDIAFRRGLTSNVNVSASGGSDRTRFYVSGSYYDEEGTLVSTGYDRVSARANLEHSVNDRFRITGRAYGTYENRLYNPSGALYDSYINLPWDEPYDEEGNLRTGREPEWRGRDQSNFLFPLEYNWSEGRFQDFSGDFELAYDLANWLTVTSANRAKFEYDRSESYNDVRTPAGSANSGSLNNSTAHSNTFLTSNLLRGNHAVGEHRISGLAGVEYQQSYFENLGGTGIGIHPGLGIMDVTAGPLSLGGGKNESAFLSALFQGEYGFRDTYFATVSFRRDGSSRFGADNRYGNFYSVAGAWIVSNEAFLQDVAALDQLKLRASYGTTGNAEIGNYVAQSIYRYNVRYNGQPGSVIARLPNPDLTWEVNHTLNFGLDLGLFNRVTVTLDAYQRENRDLLQNVPLPNTTGFNSRLLNIGSVRNRGLELGLSTVNLDGDFSWTTDFNFSINRNRVLSLYDGNPILSGNQRIIEGRDIYTWYMRKWAGVDPENGDPLWERLITDANGNVTDVELTNNYSEATLQPVGTASPDFVGGMRNRFSYRGLSLDAFFNFVQGVQVYHNARELFDSDGAYPTFNSMRLHDGWSRWAQPGDVATHPKPVSGGNQDSNKPSSRYLEDGSYLRLRNVTLSYDVPEALVRSARVGSVRIYLSGDNLLTLTDFSGRDPETGIGGGIGSRYPISRKLLIGLDLGL